MQVQTNWKAGSERSDWRKFLLQTSLTLAIMLVGGAAICWVAANWPAWTRFERLAAAQALMAASALAGVFALWRARQRPVARRSGGAAFLGLASIALGALLALVGQTYQTGANTYELFLAWALLMLPWPLAARSPSVWLLWVVVLNTAVALWGGVSNTRFSGDFPLLNTLPYWMIPLNLAALAVWTRCAGKSAQTSRSGPRLLAAVALIVATMGAIDSSGVYLLAPGLVVWLWTVLVFATVYRYGRPDGGILAMVVLSVMSMVLYFVWEVLRVEWEFSTLLTIGIVLAAGAMGHHWIRNTVAREPAVAVDSGLIDDTPDRRYVAYALLVAALATSVISWIWQQIETGALFYEFSRFGSWGETRPQVPPVYIGIVAIAVGGAAIWTLLVRRRLERHTPKVSAVVPAPGLENVDAAIDAQGVVAGTSTNAATHVPKTSVASYILLTLTAWFAAMALLVLLGLSGVIALDGPLSAIGIGMTVVGVLGARISAGSLFLRQCATALAFAGMVIVSINTIFIDHANAGGAWLMIALGTAVYLAGVYALLRFLAGWVIALGIAAVIWFGPSDTMDIADAFFSTFAFRGDHALGSWLPVTVCLSVLACAAFLLSALPAIARKIDLAPLGWSFATTTLALAWVGSGVPLTQLGALWALNPPSALVLLIGAMLPAIVCVCVMLPLHSVLPRRMLLGVPAGLVLLGLLWLPSPGIAFSLALTLLGFGLHRRVLLGVGTLSLVAYLVTYYYQMSVPLLDKALWLGLGGLATAALFGVLLHAQKRADREASRAGDATSDPVHPALRAPAWPAALALAGLVLVVGAVNFKVWQREQLLAHGTEIVLALAPVDPRSLLQGDYMALDFALARDISALTPDTSNAHTDQKGYAIVALGPHNEASLLRIQPALTPLAKGEYALQYRTEGGRVKIVTNAFFFPEGQGDHFAKGRYGALRVDQNGEALLTGLRDADYVPL